MRKTIFGRHLAASVLPAAFAAVILLSSCAGTPAKRANPQETAAEKRESIAQRRQEAAEKENQKRSDPLEAAAEKITQVPAKIAVALARIGRTKDAFDEIANALKSAGDSVSRAAAMEARAWAFLFSGSKEEARVALREAAASGQLSPTARAVLEFRLANHESLASARKAARDLAGAGRLEPRAVEALSVMSGEKDVRDVKFESPEAAGEYATYLSGYRISPEPADSAAAKSAAVSETAGDAPIVVVRDCEAVNADAATVAIARLAYRDALIKRHLFRVVDADSRKGAVEELELKLSGAAAGEKDKAVGELFAADFVASGSVVRTDSGWLVAYTLSKAADGRIVAGDFAAAADHAGIIGAAGRFAEALDSAAR